MRFFIIALTLIAAGCALKSDVSISPGNPTIGQWTPFYGIDFKPGRLDYFYDKSRVVRTGGHVVSRWKVLGSPNATTTLTVVDISCGGGTFTEKANLIIDAQGRERELPASELLVDHPISQGSSSDVIREKFCR